MNRVIWRRRKDEVNHWTDFDKGQIRGSADRRKKKDEWEVLARRNVSACVPASAGPDGFVLFRLVLLSFISHMFFACRTGGVSLAPDLFCYVRYLLFAAFVRTEDWPQTDDYVSYICTDGC